MSGSRWIISLFQVLLNFNLTAGTARYVLSSPIVRVGDEFTLPCVNAKEDQNKCDSTCWVVRYLLTQAETELVSFGQIDGNRLSKSKSDRLSLTENCSLVIKKVTVEDVGRYTCRQFDRSGRQQGPDTLIVLSVVSMTEHEDGDKMTFGCHVLFPFVCKHTVEWLHVEDAQHMTRSQSGCSATVSFSISDFFYTSNTYEFLQCKVTNIDTGKVQVFTFSPQSSGEIATTSPSAPTQEGLEKAHTTCSGCSALNSIMLLMRVAELLLITVITVLLIRARGNQRPPDDNTVLNSVRSRAVTPSGPAASQMDNEGGERDFTVNYENVGDPSLYIRFHRSTASASTQQSKELTAVESRFNF
ncbi:uncharacterized protein LOC108887450 isoform X3 [Lates calcarifer]|uniref:Uncharacterized protein LOC108887450 isoform X3 n=1 Tax=Lates calcarifer TaxID=8187 RepID=A0AAJ8B7Z3_LATCA|nr:uncharacterized protein LOC108887450 isoform X3 [Lates calcarifer]